MSWVVVRKAVLPEDEGFETMIQGFLTEQKARDWIKNQEGEYFRPGDYYVMHLVEDSRP